jgi:16S rRNA pseudouridine516 synthase
MSLLPPPLRTRGVQPVGRLDEDTTGLLLLTDDGALIHRLTSPKHHVPKVYEAHRATTAGWTTSSCSACARAWCSTTTRKPVRAEAAEATGPQPLRLTLTEGKYHQVKRMVAAVGNRVRCLHRSAFGALTDPARPGAGPVVLARPCRTHHLAAAHRSR